MRVLLTRPAEQSTRTVAILAAHGHECVVSAVIDIVPTGAAWPGVTADLLVATSARAFESLEAGPEMPPPEVRRLLPLYLVGHKTLEAARGAGFMGPAIVALDANMLAPKLAPGHRPAARALYLAGRERKPDIENACAQSGLALTTVETYGSVVASQLSDEARAALDQDAIGAVLHYSRRSAAAFLDLMKAADLDPAPLRHVVISADAAKPLHALDLPRIDVAASPNENAMLALLPES